MNTSSSKSKSTNNFLLVIILLSMMVFVISCKSSKDSAFSKTLDIPMGENSAQGSSDEVFDMVDEFPQFPGGIEAWGNFMKDNLKYPASAKDKGIEGTVYITFIINKDGSVSDAEILRGIGGGCDEEALRVVKASPNWNPGKKDGKIVRSRMRLPVQYALGKKDKS
ncbi:energy transducer TonB [Aquiflexum gelatinilyticum]|uniref:Energy transducer TonB n=1 Tax=Aquiflexum gelatinilyticum TaxID=2961943 RepID=A0A9X2P7G8_9BACT|nr:energy transducer TonB [Aquiflexum gelatinilyticum]MCR9016822.1 energy transducer TonB [Aquiflexum gelatinilyticum]MCS4434257.1 energy transducer TonB [Aquiflexum gelatinilyticum]